MSALAFWIGVSFLASTTFLVPLSLAFIIYLSFCRKIRNALILAIGLYGGVLLNSALKEIFQRDRPADALIEAGGYSFPSGHAMSAMIFYAALIMLFASRIKNVNLRYGFIAVNVLLIFMVGLSRIMLRVHYISDVIGGFVMGWVWLMVVRWMMGKEKNAGPHGTKDGVFHNIFKKPLSRKTMRYLLGPEHDEAEDFLQQAANIALSSTCLRSRCGSVIVQGGEIIGKGYNSPPCDVTLERCFKDDLPADFKSDKTCCLHAEQRAIIDALQCFPTGIKGSRLYFIRLDEQGNKKPSGQPYCTICSKMSLDVGIAEFVLWHEEGIAVYDTKEYNENSFGL